MESLQEKASKIKIVFFDIDDTLRVKNTGYLPDSVAIVFDKLREKGIVTAIATGRNLAGVVPEIKELQPDYFVTANGAYVEDKHHQTIYSHPLPQETVQALLDWLISVDSDYVFYGKDALRVSRWTPTVQDAIEIIYGKLDADPDFYKTHDVYQLLSLSDHDQEIELPESLANEVRRVRWHPNSSDIVPVSGSKAVGAQKVLDELGLTADEMMNFGDELNDLELFDLAGLSVAMKVSHPEILERADFVTDSVEADGIEKALIELGIIE